MKVSKLQASDNRDAIVKAAAAQLREHGFDQMSVTAVAQAAGLTHGALYSHFKSKDALKAAATERAFTDCIESFSNLTLAEFFNRYLSATHREHPEQGCPGAALVSEVPWQPTLSKQAFRDGIEQFVALTRRGLGAADDDNAAERSIFVFAAMVGGLALSRAIRDVDQAGSDSILTAVSSELKRSINCVKRVRKQN
ncbi:MAG: TetR/AcrR family transcriptional regulator [Rhodospirillales bacterium]|nr:TetR/AcrR family transcriptional regulator [Rhodospirillales bacterium]